MSDHPMHTLENQSFPTTSYHAKQKCKVSTPTWKAIWKGMWEMVRSNTPVLLSYRVMHGLGNRAYHTRKIISNKTEMKCFYTTCTGMRGGGRRWWWAKELGHAGQCGVMRSNAAASDMIAIIVIVRPAKVHWRHATAVQRRVSVQTSPVESHS